MLERPEEARTRRRHKTESVKQHPSQDRATATAELEQAQRQAQPAGRATGVLFLPVCCRVFCSPTSCWLCLHLNPLDHIPFPCSFSLTQAVRGAVFHTQSLHPYCWSAAGSTAGSPCQRSLPCGVGPHAAPDTPVATDPEGPSSTAVTTQNRGSPGSPLKLGGERLLHLCTFIAVDFDLV